MDPIADLLTTIKKSIAVRKDRTVVPYSRLKVQILKILTARAVIDHFEVKKENNNQVIIVHLKNERKIYHLQRISKPGRRVYAKRHEIKMPPELGFVIISTTKGIIDGREAKKLGLGGEVICQVW